MVGELVMTYLMKRRLCKGQPTKLLMKKIGPLKIVCNFVNNAYEVKSPPNLVISPILNASDLYTFNGSVTNTGQDDATTSYEVERIYVLANYYS